MFHVKVVLSTRLESEWSVVVAVPEDRPEHYALSAFLSAVKDAIGAVEYRKNTIVDAIEISEQEADRFWLAA